MRGVGEGAVFEVDDRLRVRVSSGEREGGEMEGSFLLPLTHELQMLS